MFNKRGDEAHGAVTAQVYSGRVRFENRATNTLAQSTHITCAETVYALIGSEFIGAP